MASLDILITMHISTNAVAHDFRVRATSTQFIPTSTLVAMKALSLIPLVKGQQRDDVRWLPCDS